MLDGLRAGRRKPDGSDNFFPKQTKIEDALHKSAGRFLDYLLNIVKNWCIITISVVDYLNGLFGGENGRMG